MMEFKHDPGCIREGGNPMVGLWFYCHATGCCLEKQMPIGRKHLGFSMMFNWPLEKGKEDILVDVMVEDLTPLLRDVIEQAVGLKPIEKPLKKNEDESKNDT